MESVLERQFELAKDGNISVGESSIMPYLDFESFHSLLIKHQQKIKNEYNKK